MNYDNLFKKHSINNKKNSSNNKIDMMLGKKNNINTSINHIMHKHISHSKRNSANEFFTDEEKQGLNTAKDFAVNNLNKAKNYAVDRAQVFGQNVSKGFDSIRINKNGNSTQINEGTTPSLDNNPHNNSFKNTGSYLADQTNKIFIMPVKQHFENEKNKEELRKENNKAITEAAKAQIAIDTEMYKDVSKKCSNIS